ncbi:hypothetical protein [Adlercreutzia shanghongiae]|uniref:HK97 gp10 family phage protein n=1 Tax=Adlercreutzia shanghongiae TaxID=3111773 RepID=A0ABU6IW29_9ACTN|nr:hypothetical protein [Adlercreutzia sp. R22]MEC4294047.1 hypothetical protein [Adlercreutzia sp. R22]
MNSEVVFMKSGPYGHFVVQMEGLDVLMRAFAKSDKAAQEGIRGGLERAGRPVLASARANARRIADDGTFADRMSIRFRANASRMVLYNSDPAAGVKEFANRGAKTRTSKGTPRANARLRLRSGVGVPLRAGAPRAMISAVNDNVEKTCDLINAEVSRAFEAIFHG